MYLNLMLAAILFASLALMINGGLWSNTITMMNVMLSGLLAFNYFEPLASKLTETWPSFMFIWDFLCLWMIFIASMVVLRTLTDTLSTVKVRFRRPVDLAGGIIAGLLASWLVVCFTLASLHTAPLAANFMRGDFKPEERMLFGTAPDRQWLAFASVQSRRALSRGEEFNPSHFGTRYYERRAEFEKEPGTLTNKKK